MDDAGTADAGAAIADVVGVGAAEAIAGVGV
jgi:hypothetical protein